MAAIYVTWTKQKTLSYWLITWKDAHCDRGSMKEKDRTVHECCKCKTMVLSDWKDKSEIKIKASTTEMVEDF